MKLTVFQSDKGDCLMLESGGKRMLIDGGMRDSYTRHVAPTLDKIRDGGGKLDVVYVSHVDRDHVFGVLQMMEDLVAWRVYDFHRKAPGGNRDWPKPKVKRPPEIGGIWHNVFHEMSGRNAGPIADQIGASARALSGFTDGDLKDLSATYENLASSMTDAVELSRRVGPKQLSIPVNAPFGGKLALRQDGQDPVRLGDMDIHVIGPSKSDLTKFRKKWNKWLDSESGERQLRRIDRRHRRDEDVLDMASVDDLLALRRARADELGKRSKVTLPNLVSLMLLVEAGGKSILLTGDGHWQDILDGLEESGKLAADSGLHLNVLKVQHHGSEHNANQAFGKRITADHYVFCGNGAHENPDLRVIDIFAKSRIGAAAQRSANPEVGNNCTFWFNASSSDPHGHSENLDHMQKVESRMAEIGQQSGGQIKARFATSSKVDISV